MGLYVKELPAAELEFQMFVMDELADDLLAKGADVLKLTIGIAELPIPKRVLDVFEKTLHDHEKTHQVYPQGVPALREAIAHHYKRKYKVDSTMEQVIVNVGTSAIFRNTFQLTCKPGQEILMPRPYYCLYLLSALLAEAKITYYDIDYKTKRIDMDSFRRAYDPDKTAVVVINNPGNPLGNVVPKEDIVTMNEIIAGRSFIVNDEIYNNCVFYADYECPLAYLDKEHRKNNIVTNAFSKGFRMYTKRMGFSILPESLIMPMRILQQHTLLCADPVNQYAVIEALDDDDSPRELMELYRSRAEYTTNTLKDTGTNPIHADGGFYEVLDCDEWVANRGLGSSKELAREILEEVHVSTVPGTDFGIPNGLRLSFCQARYNEGIDRLRQYFTKN